MSVHRIIIAGVMRGRRMADADAAAKQDGHLEPPAAHVLDLGDLIDDLAHGIEDEIGEHEVDDRACAGHGGPAAQADESALADRCIAEPDRAVQVIKPGRRLEVAAAYADPFAQDEDRRVARHLLGQALERRLHVADFARSGFRAAWVKTTSMATRSGSANTNRVAVAGSGQGLVSANWSASSTTASISDSMASNWDDGLVNSLMIARFEAEDRAAGFPGFDLVAGAVRVVAHALGMRPGAVGAALDQCGPVAASGTVNGLVGCLVNGQDVVAVDVDSGHSIAGAAAGHAGVAGRVGKGHFGRELVVLAHEQHRQLPDAGHVEPFVEGAVVDGAVAEEGDGHLIGLRAA